MQVVARIFLVFKNTRGCMLGRIGGLGAALAQPNMRHDADSVIYKYCVVHIELLVVAMKKLGKIQNNRGDGFHAISCAARNASASPGSQAARVFRGFSRETLSVSSPTTRKSYSAISS